MGLCESKVVPETDYLTLLHAFSKAIRTQHTFYANVLENGQFTRKTFQYHKDLEEGIQEIRDEFMEKIGNEKHMKRVSSYMREYNMLRFEYMNALLTFKRNLNQQVLNDTLIIEDKLLSKPEFKVFFSLLPDSESVKSIDGFMMEDKKRRDDITLHRQLTGGESGSGSLPQESKYQLCPHCGLNVTHDSVQIIEQSERRRTVSVTKSLSLPI
jgi:hypothetical protein